MDTQNLNQLVTDRQLFPVAEKVAAGQRLSDADGLALFRSRDLIGVGRLADSVRRQRYGRQAFFITNQHLNYTNVCSNRCEFCAYARDRGEERAFTLSLEEIRRRLQATAEQPIRELHVVGGLNDELGFDYYLDLLGIVREVHPRATIKAFTAVEIDHMARLTGLAVGEVLDRLKAAGLAMLPGGGAEVISDRIHKRLFPCKIDGRRWLAVVAAAHERGLNSNATMLYGHIETLEERVAHLVQLRSLQDRTGGFSAFIPLAFHSENTRLSHLPATTGVDDLKNVAVARLMLDNIDHIKAYWVMIGEKLAQVALSFGADDLDGTIVEEKITHMAGAKSAKGLTRSRMIGMIAAAGFRPVERDSFYRPVSNGGADPPGGDHGQR
jgi:aminodeoxyfutalosine synthase